jgi:hypothetical protein
MLELNLLKNYSTSIYIFEHILHWESILTPPKVATYSIMRDVRGTSTFSIPRNRTKKKTKNFVFLNAISERFL